ncbi:hypothetical protein UA75_25935 [Actinoalloteichus sp. GBA129-24]|uniref:Uncharacterized protein n=1 Tax=Actinoalloteichus fjordicus TaxID=1612552 RepID=A0AAC9LHP7_9PSEU|nr:hypothetical protein UA74_25350 [Actinoalloteichus fjordicus]APU23160.1 hypothetical protein UA75_25935 [Actinoalloteichus sp. GBA129-24]
MSPGRSSPIRPVWWWAPAVLLVLFSVLLAAAWSAHVVLMQRDCAAGFDQPGLTGRSLDTRCVLAQDGTTFLALDWGEIAVAAALALVVATATLLLLWAGPWRRWAGWLALVAVVVLLRIAAIMGLRRRNLNQPDWPEFTLAPDTPSMESYAITPRGATLEVRTPTGPVVVPEPSGGWLDLALVAGLLAVALTIATFSLARRARRAR